MAVTERLCCGVGGRQKWSGRNELSRGRGGGGSPPLLPGRSALGSTLSPFQDGIDFADLPLVPATQPRCADADSILAGWTWPTATCWTLMEHTAPFELLIKNSEGRPVLKCCDAISACGVEILQVVDLENGQLLGTLQQVRGHTQVLPPSQIHAGSHRPTSPPVHAQPRRSLVLWGGASVLPSTGLLCCYPTPGPSVPLRPSGVHGAASEVRSTAWRPYTQHPTEDNQHWATRTKHQAPSAHWYAAPRPRQGVPTTHHQTRYSAPSTRQPAQSIKYQSTRQPTANTQTPTPGTKPLPRANTKPHAGKFSRTDHGCDDDDLMLDA